LANLPDHLGQALEIVGGRKVLTLGRLRQVHSNPVAAPIARPMHWTNNGRSIPDYSHKITNPTRKEALPTSSPRFRSGLVRRSLAEGGRAMNNPG
jgi:hypothetical protein